MFFSFFNRFTSKNTKSSSEQTSTPQKQKELLRNIAREYTGTFYENFKLYHRDTLTRIDLLLFLPNRGIYFGETISWSHLELKGASVERYSKRTNKSPTTRLENSEWRIHQKLEDVLSFDSTPIERFFWMEYLTENDFDTLDSSFHELMPKGRLIFSDDSKASIERKLEALIPHQIEPFSKVKVIGSLSSHLLLLPNTSNPFGTLLSEEQVRFLDLPLQGSTTQLCGDYGSGKSAVLLRKALQILLDDSTQKIFIITPTRLGGELLRDELVALIEYGAFSIDLSSLFFHTPEHINSPEYRKHFQDSTHIFCDDADRMESHFIESLKDQSDGRWILVCGMNPINPPCETKLINHYRYDARHHLIRCTEKTLLMTLLNTLRERLSSALSSQIMVILDDDEIIKEYKVAMDEYLHINCRILTPSFSLQYQNLDDLILTTPQCLSGISIPHLYFISSADNQDYPFVLSRASETATIISYPNPNGEFDAENS